jgi:hypothetical protein
MSPFFMNSSPLLGNGYPQQWDPSFSLSSNDGSPNKDSSAFGFGQSPQVEWPYYQYQSSTNPLDGMSTDFSGLSDSPFLGTLMGLQSRLNDISQMQAQMNEATDPGKVPLDNPRLSEQAINSHEVEMLSQHIQSLTNQVKKLQDFINPVTGVHKNNLSGHRQASSTLSTVSGTDDSSSNTRSTLSYRDVSPAAVQNPLAVPGFESYLGDSTRQTNAVFGTPQGLSANAQDLWWGQPNQSSDAMEPRYIPTPAH